MTKFDCDFDVIAEVNRIALEGVFEILWGDPDIDALRQEILIIKKRLIAGHPQSIVKGIDDPALDSIRDEVIGCFLRWNAEDDDSRYINLLYKYEDVIVEKLVERYAILTNDEAVKYLLYRLRSEYHLNILEDYVQRKKRQE